MLSVEVDADVASLLDHCVRHVEEVHSPGQECCSAVMSKAVGRLMVVMVEVVVVNIRFGEAIGR